MVTDNLLVNDNYELKLGGGGAQKGTVLHASEVFAATLFPTPFPMPVYGS